jgi:hypothetical protein
MPEIDPSTLVSRPELESAFWRQVRAVVSDVFEADDAPVERYQILLAIASPTERLLAMHESPLEVASGLTGIAITADHIERYERLAAEFEERALRPSESASTSAPVTLQQLDDVLFRVGYERLPAEDGRSFVHWVLNERGGSAFPRVLTLSVPRVVSDKTTDRVYDRSAVLDFLVMVYGDAVRLGAPEPEARRFLYAREELQLAAA